MDSGSSCLFPSKLNDCLRSAVNKMGSESSFHSTGFLILPVSCQLSPPPLHEEKQGPEGVKLDSVLER